MLTYNYMREKKEIIMAKTQLHFIFYPDKGTFPFIPHVMQFLFFTYIHTFLIDY